MLYNGIATQTRRITERTDGRYCRKPMYCITTLNAECRLESGEPTVEFEFWACPNQPTAYNNNTIIVSVHKCVCMFCMCNTQLSVPASRVYYMRALNASILNRLYIGWLLLSPFCQIRQNRSNLRPDPTWKCLSIVIVQLTGYLHACTCILPMCCEPLITLAIFFYSNCTRRTWLLLTTALLWQHGCRATLLSFIAVSGAKVWTSRREMQTTGWLFGIVCCSSLHLRDFLPSLSEAISRLPNNAGVHSLLQKRTTDDVAFLYTWMFSHLALIMS